MCAYFCPALIKTEPAEQAVEFEYRVEAERIKSEPDELLYADHEIKEELVIGPTQIQQTALFDNYIDEDSNSDSPAALTQPKHGLLIHRQPTQKPQPKLYECAACGKRYNRRNNLVRHLHVHSDVKRFACNMCVIKFSQRKDLEIHQARNHGVKVYRKRCACTICNKTMLKKSLNIHMLIHQSKPQKNISLQSEKLFVCSVCGKGFAHKNIYVEHLYIHSEVKQFACTMCECKFSQRRGLKKHQKRHHGDGPLHSKNQCICKICNVSISEYNLQRHIKLVHKC